MEISKHFEAQLKSFTQALYAHDIHVLESFRQLWQTWHDETGFNTFEPTVKSHSLSLHSRHVQWLEETLHKSIPSTDSGKQLRAILKALWPGVSALDLWGAFGETGLQSRDFLTHVRRFQDEGASWDDLLLFLREARDKRRSTTQVPRGVSKRSEWAPYDGKEAYQKYCHARALSLDSNEPSAFGHNNSIATGAPAATESVCAEIQRVAPRTMQESENTELTNDSSSQPSSDTSGETTSSRSQNLAANGNLENDLSEVSVERGRGVPLIQKSLDGPARSPTRSAFGPINSPASNCDEDDERPDYLGWYPASPLHELSTMPRHSEAISPCSPSRKRRAQSLPSGAKKLRLSPASTPPTNGLVSVNAGTAGQATSYQIDSTEGTQSRETRAVETWRRPNKDKRESVERTPDVQAEIQQLGFDGRAFRSVHTDQQAHLQKLEDDVPLQHQKEIGKLTEETRQDGVAIAASEVSRNSAAGKRDSTGLAKSTIQGSYHTLQPGEWLSGTAIHAVLNLLRPDAVKTCIKESEYLSESSPETPTRRLTDVNNLCVPLNHNGLHWTLCWVDRIGRQAMVYDPLPGRKFYDSSSQKLMAFCNNLPDRDEAEPWTMQPRQRGAAVQDNSFDCGVYVAAAAILLMHSKPLPSSIDGVLWRRAFACAVYALLPSTAGHPPPVSVEDIMSREFDEILARIASRHGCSTSTIRGLERPAFVEHLAVKVGSKYQFVKRVDEYRQSASIIHAIAKELLDHFKAAKTDAEDAERILAALAQARRVLKGAEELKQDAYQSIQAYRQKIDGFQKTAGVLEAGSPETRLNAIQALKVAMEADMDWCVAYNAALRVKIQELKQHCRQRLDDVERMLEAS